MRAMICVTLLLGMLVAECHFDAAAERSRREHLRFGTIPASPFSAHWYLDAAGRTQLRPGHRDPYGEDEGGVAVAATMQSASAYAGAAEGGEGGEPGSEGQRESD